MLRDDPGVSFSVGRATNRTPRQGNAYLSPGWGQHKTLRRRSRREPTSPFPNLLFPHLASPFFFCFSCLRAPPPVFCTSTLQHSVVLISPLYPTVLSFCPLLPYAIRCTYPRANSQSRRAPLLRCSYSISPPQFELYAPTAFLSGSLRVFVVSVVSSVTPNWL